MGGRVKLRIELRISCSDTMLEILNELYYISSSNRIYMSTFYIEDKVCNTSKCAIQVNKVGLKPTYPNTR